MTPLTAGGEWLPVGRVARLVEIAQFIIKNETFNVRSLALQLNVDRGRPSAPQGAVQVEYCGMRAFYLARQGN